MPTTPNFSQPAIFSEVATPTVPDSGYLKVYAKSGMLYSIANGGTEKSYLAISGSGLPIGAYTLPTTDGTSSQVLQTNGSGTVTWQTVSGGGGGGITSINGNSTAAQLLTVGTSGTDFAIDSVTTAGTSVFNIPSASATARGLITTGTQTIAGAKTFTSGIFLTDGIIKTDGTLWGWGLNNKFQNGTSGYASGGGVGTITQAAGGNYVKAVGGQLWGVAIRTDGTLEATGENGSGENGMGYATQTLFGYYQVGTGHADIAATSQGTLGVTTSGQVTSTGSGRIIYPYSGGTLRGFGNIFMDGSGTTLTGVAKIAANNFIGYVIKSTGTLWAWGQNNAFNQGNNAGNGSCYGPVESGVFGNSSYLRTDTYTQYYYYCGTSYECYDAATDTFRCYNYATGECDVPYDVGSNQASLNCYKDYQPTAVQIGSSANWAKLPDTNGFNTNHAIALQS